ncbi:MAG TPA: hypothetical protein VFA26_14635 [Gemmataceae bacterium]|nr:hypothetical protein [Gemmataceae bacterium]
MHGSSAYQLIMAEGAVKEVKKLLLRQGQKRFGSPSAAMATTLEGITDLGRLERRSDRVLEATSWEELMATP